MVLNKLMNVSDELCRSCGQNWKGICSAYLQPHSSEERRQRIEGTNPLCELILKDEIKKRTRG